MKFRKKPVVIEAVRWTGKNWEEIKAMDPEHRRLGLERQHLYVSTLEGILTACIGDWIIKGVRGELYPCKPEIFAATYEPVEGSI